MMGKKWRKEMEAFLADEELFDELEDKAHLHRHIEVKEDGTPIFFSNGDSEDQVAKYHIDLALEKIASMYANERRHRDSFLTEDEYIAHKEELKDREIVMLLAVRDWNPAKIDDLVNILD